MVKVCPGLGIVAVCAVLMTITTTDAMAADVRVVIEGAGSFRAIAIEGHITTGDFDTFIRLIKEHQAAIVDVYLFSPGGDFTEAMKIGRALRVLELSSRVPVRTSSDRPSCDGAPGIEPTDPGNCTCASACFFIHVASTHRGGDYLAVHRPYFATGEFGRLSQRDAMKAFDALQRTAAQYMDEMGVPKHVQEDVLGTPSDRTLILDGKTVETYFSGDLPYRHEWIRSRCSRLSPDERGRLERFSERPLRGGPAADARPADREPAEVRDLQARQSEERTCAIAVHKESRLTAYEKYFRHKAAF